MINSIYQKQITMIHNEMNLGEEMKHSNLQADFNQFKSVLLGLISTFKYTPEKTTWNISDLYDVVETMIGEEDTTKTYHMILKAVNYLTASKTKILDIHFVYFLEIEGSDEKMPMTPTQYHRILKDKEPDFSVLTEDQIAKIGGIENFKTNRLGFYCTIIPQEVEEVQEIEEK